MTDYELTSLFYQAITMTNMFLMSYVSVFFAFLVSSYFAADKLARPMVVLVICLFTAASVYLIMAMYYAQMDANEISRAIAARMAQGNYDIDNLGPARNPATFWIISQGFAMVGGYIGSLVFFFYQRQQGLSRSRQES